MSFGMSGVGKRQWTGDDEEPKRQRVAGGRERQVKGKTLPPFKLGGVWDEASKRTIHTMSWQGRSYTLETMNYTCRKAPEEHIVFIAQAGESKSVVKTYNKQPGKGYDIATADMKGFAAVRAFAEKHPLLALRVAETHNDPFEAGFL